MADFTVTVHPELSSNLTEYNRIDHFVDGRPSAIAQYVRRYKSEGQLVKGGPEAFQGRLERLYNKNLCQPYLDLHHGHLVRNPNIDIGDSEKLAIIKSDATGRGESAEWFQREVIYLLLKHGRVGVLVDGPAEISPTGEDSAAERAYMIIYKAEQIVDWSRFANGRFRGQLSKLTLLEETNIRDGKKYRRFRHFERDGLTVNWKLLEEEGNGVGVSVAFSLAGKETIGCNIVESGTMGANVSAIPFHMFGDGIDESYIRNIVHAQDAHMNLTSVLTNVNYYQGFEKVIFFGVNPDEITRTGEAISTAVKNDKASVTQLSSGQPLALENEISSLAQYIARVGKFEFNQLAEDTRQVQSSESKAKDMVARKGIYDYTLDVVEDGMNRIWAFVCLFEGDSYKVTVKFDRDYGLDDPDAERLQRQALLSAAERNYLTPIVQQILKVWVSEMAVVPNEGADEEATRQVLYQAIDAMAPLEPMAAGVDSFFGNT